MINVLKPKYRIKEILNSIEECLESGWTGLGGKTVEFEDKWKTFTKLPNAHYVNSATSGLHLALHILKKKLKWSDNDEIITTPLTFVSTNHSILYENLKPVFADVDEYLCLDPIDIENKITNKTKAVMFVGLGGNAGQLDKISNLCKKYNLKLIVDAAHMAGTITKHISEWGFSMQHIGNEADAIIFSFQAVKNLPTSDSGMLCFKDNEFDNLARQLSWLGIDKDTYQRFNKGNYKWMYDVPNLGFKYHGNALTAAIGLVQLQYLVDDNNRRNEISKYYDDNLDDIPWCTPITNSDYTWTSSRHLYQVLVDGNRDDLIEFLYKHNIYPGVHYNDNTNYNLYSYASGTCPNAHKYSKQLITLPIHCNLTNNDLKNIISKLKEWK